MLALKVPKRYANDLRKFLQKNESIAQDFRIKSDEKFVYFPLKKVIHDSTLRQLPYPNLDKVEMVESEFESLERLPRNFKDLLQGQLAPEKLEDLKKSFDIIGDIIILEIPEELQKAKYSIGKAALDFTKKRSVYMKGSKVKGVTRTRELEHLYGEDNSQTIHQEYGCKLALDVREVYFSPRLATERYRIASQVKDGEIILDMFAGVGPFSIIIAKNKKVKIYGVDINPQAIEFLKKNLKLNKLKGEVFPILGDVRKFIYRKNFKFNRIIMNLPGSAFKFLYAALDSLLEGGIIHYYEFASDDKRAIHRIQKAAQGRSVEILYSRKVKSTSPGEWQIVVDAQIGKREYQVN